MRWAHAPRGFSFSLSSPPGVPQGEYKPLQTKVDSRESGRSNPQSESRGGDPKAQEASWGLTQVVPFRLGVLVNVLLRETAEEDAVEAGVQPVQVDAAHVTHARLRLKFRRES